jgi:osmotically-inducible protein OsmY
MRPPAARARARSALQRRGRRAADRRAALAGPVAAAAGGLAAGGLLTYFLDPKAGRRRRHVVRDRARSRLRHGEQRAMARARRAESHAVGVARRTINARRREEKLLDDLTLAHEVESRLHHQAGLPKGQVSVNAEEGVVFLRGVLERDEDIERAGEEAQRIAGVRGVENLIHAPGTPAPPSRSKLERRQSGA